MLVSGAVAAFGIGSVQRDSARRAAAHAMDGRTELMTAAVMTEVGRYLDEIRTLAAAAGAVDDLTAAKFRQVNAPLATMGLSGAVSVAFVVPATDDQVAAVQTGWRRRGATGLRLQPIGAGPHLFAVLSSRLDGQKLGSDSRDLARVEPLRAALNEALRADTVAVSDTYQIFADSSLPVAQRQHSFVLAAPVYASTGMSGGGRASTFRGWLLMDLRGQDFARATLSRVAQSLVDVTLSAPNADGSETVVASLAAVARGARDLHRRVEIPVAQRRWELRTAAAHAALPGGSQFRAAAMTAALFVPPVLVAALVAALAAGRTKAHRLAAAATAATDEMRRAEREMREQAHLLGTILDTITDGVGVVDNTGRYLIHNPAARAMLGVDDDPTHPDDWQQHYGIYRPDSNEPFPLDEMPLIRALHGESPTGIEQMIRNPGRPDGLLITTTARQLALANGLHGAVAVFRDVTDDRAHEAELSGFAGVVAHDLKSPLTTVVGYSELVEDTIHEALTGPVQEEALTHLARIKATTARMRTLIDDLLAYSTARDAMIQPMTFSLYDLVHEVASARMDAAQADRNAGYFPDIRVGPLPAVHADPVLVRQVLENLVGNAIKYTAPGQPAQVNITGDTQPGRAGQLMARVEIADRGIGLPPGEHSRVFARFHRAHPDSGYPGTGLGLSICQRIVERHGGTIAATDNPGGGARFRFSIPAAPPNVAEAHAARPATCQPAEPGAVSRAALLDELR